ncbi:MAG: hypothetical protein LM523_15130 [Candidatus Contendobacter sp.]|nr:hypothetical protein [Candidatus Contendobacter sp.]
MAEREKSVVLPEAVAEPVQHRGPSGGCCPFRHKNKPRITGLHNFASTLWQIHEGFTVDHGWIVMVKIAALRR